MSNTNPSQYPDESAWAYTKRVHGYCSDGAINFLAVRLELKQLGKLKRYPVSACVALERELKADAHRLIQAGVTA